MTGPTTPGGRPVRVVLVDDQTLVRHGIRGLLGLADGVEVVAEAGDGAEGVAAVVEHDPDVLLLDLRMPRRDGLWALTELRSRGLDVPVLVLTTFDDDELVLSALRAGARGYLLKDVTLDQLVGAVRTLADGGTLISPAVTDRLLRAVRDGPPRPTTSPASPRRTSRPARSRCCGCSPPGTATVRSRRSSCWRRAR